MCHVCLNGNQALRLTAEILSAIQQNPGSMRCELAKLQRYWECILLHTILSSCCASISLQEPEILNGDRLRFNTQSIPPLFFVNPANNRFRPANFYNRRHRSIGSKILLLILSKRFCQDPGPSYKGLGMGIPPQSSFNKL